MADFWEGDAPTGAAQGGGDWWSSDAPTSATSQGQAQAPAPTQTWGDIGKDVAASTAIGVPKGIIGFAGLPEQLAGWGAQGLSYLTGRPAESFRDPVEKRLPSTQEIQRAVEDLTGPFYEPK